MPSNMVSLGWAPGQDRPGARQGAGLPLLASCAVPVSSLFPIHKWRVNAGINSDYHKWWSGVTQLCAALRMSVAQLHEAPPDYPPALDVYLSSRSVATRAAIEAATTEHARLHAVADSWRVYNTALYWHVRPSLDLSGPEFLIDERKVNSMFSGLLASGRELVLWALEHADQSSADSQLNLLSALAFTKLKEGATRAEFSLHAQSFLQRFLLIFHRIMCIGNIRNSIDFCKEFAYIYR